MIDGAMQGRLLALAVCLASAFAAGAAADDGAARSPVRKRVLILHSYHQGLTWTDGEDQGLRAVLADRKDVEFFTEYLDSKRIPLEQVSGLFAEFLARKYAGTLFDVVVATDNSALAFLRQHHGTLFSDTPVVFCGINNFTPDLLQGLDDLATGVVQTLDPHGTIELIQTLQPELETLAMVSGTTPTARAIRDKVRAALAEYPEPLRTAWLDGLATKTLLDRLAGLSRNDAVLLCNFNRDAEGVYYSHEDGAQLISQASEAPVYAMADLYIGTGVTGGSLVSATDQGRVAARLCLEVLDTGRVPSVVMSCPQVLMFDDAVLKRFGLDASRLPSSAVVVNRPVSFFARHRRLIWSAAVVFLLLLLAVAGLTYGLVRSRQAARGLRRNEENLRTTLNSIGDAVIATDTAGRIVRLNPVAARLTGWRPEEAVGRALTEVFDIVDARTKARVAAPVDRVLETGDIVGLANHTMLLARDGCEYQIADSAAPIRGDGGRVTGVVLVFRDVTEDYRMRETLRKSEERMDLVLRGADLGWWDWDIPNAAVTFDERSAALLGYTLAETESTEDFWRSRIHPEDLPHVAERITAHLEGQSDSYEVEFRLRHKSGAWIWVLNRGRVIERDADGRPLRACGTHLEITGRKRAEEERRTLEDQFRQSQKMEAVGQLAGGVAHDFNNILTAILGNVEFGMDSLRGEFGADHRALQSMEEIERAAQRASTLTRQLLTFSRRDITKPEALDLNQVLAGLDRMLRRLITENITLDTLTDPELKPIRADAGQLEQVIVNLVVNAVHAMPDGGRLILETRNAELDEDYTRGRAEARPGPHVRLAVSDTGHGMDAATLERIFEPFFTTKPVDKGTGLGLATVHGIVKQSGGHILVYSEPERGTTFKIYLPAIEATDAEQAPLRPADVSSIAHETILLCEDDRPVRELIAESLRSVGYTVITAGNGQEGVEAAEAHLGPIDLLLTDVIMPDMNGRALAERLGALRPGLPALFVSGYTSDVVAHHGVLEAGVEFLEKPFTRSALLTKVRAVLGKARSEA